MKALGEQLFIIHSQYNTLELKNQEYQLYLLDALASTQDAFAAYSKGFQEFIKRKGALTVKAQELASLESKMDYEQFILTEIQALNLGSLDYEELSRKLEVKEDSQDLISDLTSLISLSESPMLHELSSLVKTIERHEDKANSLQEIKTIIHEISTRFSELSYLSNKALQHLESTDTDEEEMLSLVDEFNRILNKHRRMSQEALMDMQVGLEGRVSELEELHVFISNEEAAIEQLEKELTHRAIQLNDNRKRALPHIEELIQSGLIALKLSGAQLTFNLIDTQELNSRGKIDLEMLFSANKGMNPVPIQKAASGGELSRVMLLLQQLISTKLQMPSILFDEIDTGVSGDVAEKIGKLLKEMGQGRQLFTITHLPQVAAQAQHHLVVHKMEIDQRIQSSVSSLSPAERITEIARLMSGEVINEAAMLNARKLLDANEV